MQLAGRPGGCTCCRCPSVQGQHSLHRSRVIVASKVDRWWWNWLPPVLARLGRRERKNNSAYQCFCPQRFCQQIPASPAHVLKLVTKSPLCTTQVLFSLPPLCWYSQQMRLYVPLKNRVFAAHHTLALPDMSSVVFQSHTIRGFIFLAQVPWAGESDVGGSDTSLLREAHCYRDTCLWVSVPGLWILTRPCLCPSYPTLCGFFFISSVVSEFSAVRSQRSLFCV